MAAGESAMRRLAGRRLYHCRWKFIFLIFLSASSHVKVFKTTLFLRGLCESDTGLQCSSVAAASFEEYIPVCCCTLQIAHCTLHVAHCNACFGESVSTAFSKYSVTIIHVVWSDLISRIELHENLLLCSIYWGLNLAPEKKAWPVNPEAASAFGIIFVVWL